MSLALRVQYHYRSFRSLFATWQLPAWLFSWSAKVAVMCLVVVAGLAYVFEINNLSTSGYVIHTLEVEVATITNETQKLSTEVAAAEALASIQKRLPEVNLVAADRITYLKAPADLAVAQR